MDMYKILKELQKVAEGICTPSKISLFEVNYNSTRSTIAEVSATLPDGSLFSIHAKLETPMQEVDHD